MNSQILKVPIHSYILGQQKIEKAIITITLLSIEDGRYPSIGFSEVHIPSL